MIKANLQSLRIAPRKTRLVIDLVRGMKVTDALNQLKFLNKKSALPISKLIKSAVAGAEHNYNLDRENLFIKEIRSDEGPTLKRWMARAFGRASSIHKRTSHVSLELGLLRGTMPLKANKQKIEKPLKLGAEPKDKKSDLKDEDKNIEIENKDIHKAGHHEHHKPDTKNKGFVSKIFNRKAG